VEGGGQGEERRVAAGMVVQGGPHGLSVHLLAGLGEVTGISGAAPALGTGMTEKKVLVPGPDHPITLEPSRARVTVTLGGRVIADTTEAITLREAGYPPVQYIPLADVDADVLRPSDHATYCPFKGEASYHSLQVGDDLVPAAVWFYRAPYDAVAAVKDHVAFYAQKVDRIDVHRAA
jgi:uncharacterized protein (DUF427 family)